MDSRGYLKSYGWVEGEALSHGGLKKPILVKHKKDTKGLGHDSKDGDAWWERLFDGALKGLDVTSGANNSISFKQNDIKPSAMKQSESPLYKMFVKGEGLAGTVGNTKHVEVKQQEIELSEVVTKSMKVSFETDDKSAKKLKKDKKSSKKEKKDKKDRKEKKVKEEKSSKRKRSESEEVIEQHPQKKSKKVKKEGKQAVAVDTKDKKNKKDKKIKKKKS